ncbi:protein of unknown function (plasmid) [Cupriavidus taiwanensis]|uniref:Uncharacterized protein n=1 Tax=Cupriavidus taiwanensis TaxID=164546 RepID=A0A375INF7_9BURK|nr:protein of unknown function [Cupriavidus taiwanensis]
MPTFVARTRSRSPATPAKQPRPPKHDKQSNPGTPSSRPQRRRRRYFATLLANPPLTALLSLDLSTFLK